MTTFTDDLPRLDAAPRLPGAVSSAGRGAARIWLVVAGSTLVALGVAVTLWTGLGPGPLDVFIGAVRTRTGLPLGIALWLVVGSIVAIAWTLGRRPGPATLLAPLVIGPTMQRAVEFLDGYDVPPSLLARAVVHAIAVAVIGIGAGAMIVSGLGAGSGELLASAAAERSRRPPVRVRMLVESTWLVVGALLGGPIGLGTVIVALAIGPAVHVGHRAVDRASRAGLAAGRRAAWAIPPRRL